MARFPEKIVAEKKIFHSVDSYGVMCLAFLASKTMAFN